HANGGVKAIITDNDKPIEVEGGEIIINKKAAELHKEELSKINQSAGNGVPIYKAGGEIKGGIEKIVLKHFPSAKWDEKNQRWNAKTEVNKKDRWNQPPQLIEFDKEA